MKFRYLALLASIGGACADGGGGNATPDAAADSDADGDLDGDTDTDADGDTDFECPAAEVGAALGREQLLVGGSMSDESFAAAPFDIRYRYLSADVPESGPCAACDEGCFVDGVSCANEVGCPWWGCWQYDQLPPGRYVADHVAATAAAGAVPMITYYIWFSVAGEVEGAPEIAALDDGAALTQYLADYAFLLAVLAEQPEIAVILHLEPDLWGYGQLVDADPSKLPVALAAAAPGSECDGLADDLVGLAGCMLALARERAPNVLVGFHASGWANSYDALNNSDPEYDIAADAQETADFMRALGADAADLVVVEMSDRDAGFDGRWWDPTNASLPSFGQAIEWVAELGAQLESAPLWWQVPYGHGGLEDVCDRYQDNRVDYLFEHPGEFASAGALGVAFGAGAGCMTTPETDDGHFLGHAATYFAEGGPPLCGG